VGKGGGGFTHLGDELLRLELGVGERARARAAAPRQRRRGMALPLPSGVAHRRRPLERPGARPLPKHERGRRGQRLLVDGHSLGGVPRAYATGAAAGGGGGPPLRRRRPRRGRRGAGDGDAGEERAHRAWLGRLGENKKKEKILASAAAVQESGFGCGEEEKGKEEEEEAGAIAGCACAAEMAAKAYEDLYFFQYRRFGS
jgi:hypothetical protein